MAFIVTGFGTSPFLIDSITSSDGMENPMDLRLNFLNNPTFMHLKPDWVSFTYLPESKKVSMSAKMPMNFLVLGTPG